MDYTSSTNKAADGQNGIETNFARDVIKANDLIFGKFLGYAYYGNDFRATVNDNSSVLPSNSGDVFDYINWSTPIVDIDDATVRVGEYAGHSSWGAGVETIYEKLTYSGAGSDYSDYVSGISPNLVGKAATGINFTSQNFDVEQNGQNSKGFLDGSWTVIAK